MPKARRREPSATGKPFLVELTTSGVLLRAWGPAGAMNEELRLLQPAELPQRDTLVLWDVLDRMVELIKSYPGLDKHCTFPSLPPRPEVPSQSDLSFYAASVRGWLEARIYSSVRQLPPDSNHPFYGIEAFAAVGSRTIASRGRQNGTGIGNEGGTEKEHSAMGTDAVFVPNDIILARKHKHGALDEEWVKLLHLRDELRSQEDRTQSSAYALRLYEDSRRRVVDLVSSDPVWAREVEAVAVTLPEDTGLAGVQVATVTLLSWLDSQLMILDNLVGGPKPTE